MDIFYKGESVTVGSTTHNIQIFKRIGMIGDSLASGYIDNGSRTVTNSNNSWLAMIARRNGITPVFYAMPGMYASLWLTDYKSAMETDADCDAYIIALGTNDHKHYALGNADDTEDAGTYCGYINAIIASVHTAHPYAAIFVTSLYNSSSTYTPMSAALVTICGMYDYCFYINFVRYFDMKSHDEFISGGHYLIAGYEKLSEVIEQLIEESIEENMDWFKMLI